MTIEIASRGVLIDDWTGELGDVYPTINTMTLSSASIFLAEKPEVVNSVVQGAQIEWGVAGARPAPGQFLPKLAKLSGSSAASRHQVHHRSKTQNIKLSSLQHAL